MSVLVLLGCGLALVPGFAVGQEAAGSANAWTSPRTLWGDPDLQGIWDSKTLTPMERPEKFADREYLTDEEIASLEQAHLDDEGRDVRAELGTEVDVEGAYNNIYSTSLDARYIRTKRSSLIVDPPNGKFPPLTTEGEATRAAALRAAGPRVRREDFNVPYAVDIGRSYDNPEDVRVIERCAGVTMPCTGGLCAISRLVQSPESVMIYYEQGHGGGAYRTISLDGRPHFPPHIRQWLGHSIGHWEGDTLVVDTTNFSDRTNFLGSAEGLHLVERFTRVKPDMIKYEITVEDSAVWTRPWTMELALTGRDNTENLIFESACHEGNYSLTGMLAGARIEEAARAGK